MKCPECDGYKNFVSLAGTPFEVVRPCKRCNGTGEIELTEQEYLQTCDMEQLADKLTDFSFWLVVTIPTEDRREKVKKRIVEWLKQPHRKGVTNAKTIQTIQTKN